MLNFAFVDQESSIVDLLADGRVHGRRPGNVLAACVAAALLSVSEGRPLLLVLLHHLADVLFNLGIQFVRREVICIDLELELEGLLRCLGSRNGLSLRLLVERLQLLLLLPIWRCLLLRQLQFLRLNQLLQLHAVLQLLASFEALGVENGGEVSLGRHLRLARDKHAVWVAHAVLERITQRLVHVEIGRELLLIGIELLERKLVLLLSV